MRRLSIYLDAPVIMHIDVNIYIYIKLIKHNLGYAILDIRRDVVL